MFTVHRKRNIMFHIVMFLFGYSIANAKHPPQVNKTRLSLIHSGLFQNQEANTVTKFWQEVFEAKLIRQQDSSRSSDFVKIKNSLSHKLEDY